MTYERILGLLLGTGAVGATVVAGLAAAALVRRRSWPYLLVAGALGTLLVRFVAGVGHMQGSLGAETHHLLEHGLDVAMAALVIAAVAVARDVSETTGGDPR